ncbi:hypothetical protein [Asanoa sp. NPDC050611]|uniref:hypothetical protein n=1 Tax=Asanoa sp. NPDC050611 TaxID=3157098 RepID=UPI0033F987D6
MSEWDSSYLASDQGSVDGFGSSDGDVAHSMVELEVDGGRRFLTDVDGDGYADLVAVGGAHHT